MAKKSVFSEPVDQTKNPAHGIVKGDPRIDGPYLDDIDAEHEEAYRKQRMETERAAAKSAKKTTSKKAASPKKTTAKKKVAPKKSTK